jgi:hypothetical protein
MEKSDYSNRGMKSENERRLRDMFDSEYRQDVPEETRNSSVYHAVTDQFYGVFKKGFEYGNKTTNAFCCAKENGSNKMEKIDYSKMQGCNHDTRGYSISTGDAVLKMQEKTTATFYAVSRNPGQSDAIAKKQCNNCQERDLESHYKFCPNCGREFVEGEME